MIRDINYLNGVLLAPEVYDQMLETIENYRLLIEAKHSMANVKTEDFVSADVAMKELGIDEAELKPAGVALE